jgi:hypothetical protein
MTSFILLLYADPGSGALVWQLLVGAFIGAMFYFRRVREWLLFWKTKRKAEPPASSSDSESNINAQ